MPAWPNAIGRSHEPWLARILSAARPRGVAASFVVAATVAALCAPAAADDGPPLVLERTIPLAGVSGRIDHLALDAGRGRLFVAEPGNGSVDVVDLGSGRIVRRLTGFRAPQGVGFAPGADALAIANAGDGSVHVLRGGDFTPIGIADLGSDADNIRLAPDPGMFVVGYGDGGLALLDAAGARLLGQLGLPAHPEGFQIDAAGRGAFVNLPDARQIAVLDLTARRQLATWRLPGLGGNFPMALADDGKTVIAVFRDPARLVSLNAADGAVRASLDTCGDADDVFFDARRRRAYVVCGEGVVDVIAAAPDRYRRIGQVASKGGARTGLFVPGIDRLFVAARAGLFGYGWGTAAILVLRSQP